ncbi:MAG: CAP domain-containing protein [Crocinitomicaceae bacterium]
MNRCILLLLVLFSVSSFTMRMESGSAVPFHKNPNGGEVVLSLNAEFEHQLFELINEKRLAKGILALKSNDGLMRASLYHAADMANENYHEHATYNRTYSGLKLGLSTFKRIAKFYNGFANSENIAAGYSSPEDVLNAWIESPGHHENLFNKNATEMGVGFYYNAKSEFGSYWVFESGVQ